MTDKVVPQTAPLIESDVEAWRFWRGLGNNDAAEVGAGEAAGAERGAGLVRESNGNRAVSGFTKLCSIGPQTSCRRTPW